MAYVPIFLDVTGRTCLVIGEGQVAAAKVASLLEAGAQVTVISPSLSEALGEVARHGRILLIKRRYQPGDMAGAALVYAATDDAELHQRLQAEARDLGIPLNVADAPQLCTFIAPAVLTRGPLKIAVLTSGASPAMAKRIRGRLERLFGPEYGLTLEVLRAARHYLKANEPNIHLRAKKLTRLAASRFPEYLRKGNLDAVEKIVLRETGVNLAVLGLSGIRGSGIRGSALPAASVEKATAR